MVKKIKKVLTNAKCICKNKFTLIQNKSFWVINFLTLVVLSLYFIFFIQVKKLDFFPTSKSLMLGTFSDREKSGNSIVELKIISDTLLNFKFKIGLADPYPYAGINLDFNDETELDVSKYNAVAIDFTNKDLNHMSLFLNVKDEHVINKSHPHATRRLLSDLFVDTEKSRQTTVIPFNQMQSPNWWYEELNQSKKEFGEPNWKRLSSISISNGINSGADQFHEFKVHKIYFFKDYTNDILLLVSLQLACLVVSGMYFIFRKKMNSKLVQPNKIEISYKPVINETLKKHSNEDFLSFIHINFSNSELSLTMVAEQTGANSKLISDSIAERFQCNFKTYINKIRIEEAKRLLKITDFNINEIAYMVGFNSPGHFNRVFKNYTNTTPTEFITSCYSNKSVLC